MLWFLLSCATGPLDAPPRLLLARHPEKLTSISLPDANRDDAPPRRWSVGGWKKGRSTDGLVEWTAPFPSRTDLQTRGDPRGVTLYRDERKIAFRDRGAPLSAQSWTWKRRRLALTLPKGERPGSIAIDYPAGRRLERRLHKAHTDIDERAFLIRSEPVRGTWRHGVYLPAPASATWRIVVPPEGRFKTDALLLRPGIRDTRRSDGAELTVSIDGHELAAETVTFDAKTISADLSEYAGRQVDLTLSTTPREHVYGDHVFLAEPRVRDGTLEPRRVLMVFIDTLRQDHVSAYGYGRQTTPNIDAVAARGLRFENARSVAPWTMPSARASVSGREPERWQSGRHIGKTLGEHGFISVAVVGNRWISETFDFAEGWSAYAYEGRAVNHRRERLEDQLEGYEDDDVVVLFHLMEPHLPYREPEPHSAIWAQAPPTSLPGPIDSAHVVKAWENADADERRAIKTHLIDRYDQNIHFADAELKPLLEAFSEDLVVIYSDHGEEFWEHGNVEHGWDLTEEQLRVPLIFAGNSIPPGVSSKPATLTDIVPTLLDVLELPIPDDLDGLSLLTAPEDRPTAFGWTLFGDEGWGVVSKNKKWITRSSHQRVFDLTADPTEDHDLNAEEDLDTRAFQEALADVRKRPVVEALRVVGPGDGFRDMKPKDIHVEVEHSSGFSASWTMWDPRARDWAPVVADGTRLTMTPNPRLRSPREFFATVNDIAVGSPKLRVRHRGVWHTGTSDGPRATVDFEGHSVHVAPHVLPLPVELTTYEIDPATQSALEALGYIDP